MARRSSGSASWRTRGPRGRRAPASRLGRSSRTLVAVLLLATATVTLERAGWLPEPVAHAVRSAEGWLEPLLRQAGIELPPPSGPGAGTRPADERAAVLEALTLLDGVPVAAERPRGYDREGWRHWLDVDGDCQDARQEVLAAESLEAARLGPDGCRVTDGPWRDAYTGEAVRDPGDLDVDHMVPLAEAHRSGGHAWSQERRAAFANDLGDARTLIAVSASANRSKGDQGPEEWLPPAAAYRCRYAADWVAVKARWSLSMDERERVTVSNLLRNCARP